ncbi:succinylglutamate desuccinylase/aspartoacylase domain-containing protein [Halovivax gelatinilyticus]|uniref:succinylglutamate desuccinylase/aspartoacylase domain-containing protein n=1 Tax=Halovivax gelatinilyticus TaxID=2961597 RepID=UPI0020CA66CB|nr:succinylglutamate desuccinylase/aspartoacylase family protein [Halovivax gelatinilyticus]
MRVEQLGTGDPSVALVGGIHGDEPCGVNAIDRLLETRPEVIEPVKFVVANELAIEQSVRYVEEDLNRAFPGDPDGSTHESRLAARLAAELEGCYVCSMHSTQSHASPFAVVDGLTGTAKTIGPQLPVSSLVETGPLAQGRLFTGAETIEVECGLQGTETATENAYTLARAFLTATGVLPGETSRRPLPVFRLNEMIAKKPADRYELFVDNFERVEPGQPFAAADGTVQTASEAFYPVLMSPNGYENVFGYAARRIDVIE